MKPRKTSGIMTIHSTSWSCPLLIQKTSPTAYLLQFNEICFSGAERGEGGAVTQHTYLPVYLHLASAKTVWGEFPSSLDVLISSNCHLTSSLCWYEVTATTSCSQPSNYCSKNWAVVPFSWAHTEFSSWFWWDLHGHTPMAFGQHLRDPDLQFLSELVEG